jgi:hypothetical protein
LWIAAVLIMIAAVIYQRRTGPTYPKRGAYELAGEDYRYKLIRSEWSTTDARVALPLPADPDVTATLRYKRYPTQDPFTEVPFVVEDDEMAAYLPKQPAAGKLAYYVEISAPNERILVPEDAADDPVLIRFRDPVPAFILWPHVIMMFFSILIGMRAGLSALFEPSGMRRWSWIALIGMTIGGMILGPVVQKYAFGAYWTGFPFGGDLTDNKMLIMWVVWLAAAALVGFKPKPKETSGRIAVVLAAVVMTVVYLIPHSMRGSELDYTQVEQGVDPRDAVGTGD